VDDFFRLAGSEKLLAPDVDVLLATVEQLGLVSWMPPVKRVEVYPQNQGSNPCAAK
jgi:hypothetical protein